MSAPQAGTRLWHTSLETRAWPRIDHLLGLALKISDQLLHAANAFGIERRLECRRLRRHVAALDRAPFRQPLLQATVEHTNILVTERQEHPPRARRRDPSACIVQHHRVVVANAERADVAAELFGGRKHVRQGA